MIQGKRVVALIPARGGSKGLPRKNLRHLAGLPLVGWPIRTAIKSQYVDRVIVSTEDSEIAAVASFLGADVPFLRPAELASDTAGSAEVIEHALNFLAAAGDPYDYIILLEPTSPLTEAADVDSALERLDCSRAIADSIAGVSRVGATHPAFDVTINPGGVMVPYNGKDFSAAGRRQDLSELYFFDGTLYISDVTVFLERKSFYHERALPFIVPKWKSFEVDDLVDFICIEAIMNNLERIKSETTGQGGDSGS